MNEKTEFRKWFEEHLGECAEDILTGGADGGFPHITYNSDVEELYDRFEDDIWYALEEDAQALGYRNVLEMVSYFRSVGIANSIIGFKTLLVWYMVERTASEVIEERRERNLNARKEWIEILDLDQE